MDNEHTSRRIASLASRGLLDPASLTLEEIREVCGSCLTQAPDHNAMAAPALSAYNAMRADRPGLAALSEALLGPNKLGDGPALSGVLMELANQPPNPLLGLAAFRVTEPSA